MARPHEDLLFAVESWTQDGTRWEEVLARAANVAIAHAAFDAAKQCRPKARLKIRQGAWLIRDSGETNGRE